MGKILIENIEVYAFHGHMEEEQKIGGNFLINVELETDLERACETDKLEDTFNYETAYQIIREEMKVKSALLEHVAGRIIRRLLETSPLVKAVKIKVSKLNPPFGGTVRAVSVELQQERLS
jgi:dihydroneopterin aldolase